MSKIVTLKIEPRLWDLIEKGKKEIEVRKINKDHIKQGDIIRFIDLDGNELGFAKVLLKHYSRFSSFDREVMEVYTNFNIDQKTLDFVRENYSDEEILLIFTIDYLPIYEEEHNEEG